METLYRKDKNGSTRFWKVSVENIDNVYHIVKRYGQVDGKEVMTSKDYTKGKNIGRSNETTPEQQALSEAHSAWKKQIEAGYSIKRNNKDLIILPMLANSWDDRSHNIRVPFIVQPKLDGVRMIIGKHKGKIVMLSRTGKVVHHLEHIRKEVEPFLEEGDFLDGENYSPEKTFEEITGSCRTTLDKSASQKDLEGIKFYIFDFFNLEKLSENFQKRFEKLLNIFQRTNFKHIHMVDTEILDDKSEVRPKHDFYVQKGYEGIMIRNLHGPYELSKRSNHLLKHKAFTTEEYRIVDAKEATGKDKETVVWICETHNGERFSVRPKGTLQQRKDWFRAKHRWTTGKYFLTVQYQNLTTEGFPRFPVGLTIRDYE